MFLYDEPTNTKTLFINKQDSNCFYKHRHISKNISSPYIDSHFLPTDHFPYSTIDTQSTSNESAFLGEKRTHKHKENNMNLFTDAYKNRMVHPSLLNYVKDAYNGRTNHSKRKYKSDDIRKKIKARFHKSLKCLINELLRRAGSEMYFDYFPQSFVANISKPVNNDVMDLTLREIFQTDFINIDTKKRKIDKSKYERNIAVIEYLDNNTSILKQSNVDNILSMKYKDLLCQYFLSNEFLMSIHKLQKDKEDEDYIKEYLIKSFEYVNYYS